MFLPTVQFAEYVEEAARCGLAVGNHYRGRQSFKTMVQLMSQYYTSAILNYLRTTKTPFTLLADGSTDKSGVQVILVYIRFADHLGVPETKFLFAQRMVESETGVNVKNMIVEFFKKHKMDQTLIDGLSGLTTDGASNMSGGKKGLRAELSKYVNTHRKLSQPKPLTWIHCMPHRLELALKDAFKQDPRMLKLRIFVTKMLNRIKSYYGSKSSSRLRGLEECAKMTNTAFIRLSGVFDVRWTASERGAMVSLVRMYSCVLINLHQTINSNTAADRVKKEALSMYLVLKQQKFFSYLLFSLEYLDVIAQLSKELQTSSLDIGSSQRKVKNAMEKLEELKDPFHVSNVMARLDAHIGCISGTKTYKITHRDCVAAINIGWNTRTDIADHNLIYVRTFPTAPNGPITHILEPSGKFNTAIKSLDDDWPDLENQVKVGLEKLRQEMKDDTDVEKMKRVLDSIETTGLYGEYKTLQFPMPDAAFRSTVLTSLQAKLGRRFKQDQYVLDMDLFSLPKLMQIKDETDDVLQKRRSAIYSAMYPPGDKDEIETNLKSISILLDQHSLSKHIIDEVESIRSHPQLLLSFLIRHSKDFKLNKHTIRLYQFIFSISSNSADVERGFSSYFYLRDSRRSKTLVSNWHHILMVLSQPLPHLPQRDAETFAKIWLLNGKKLVDDVIPTRGPSKSTQQLLPTTVNTAKHFFLSLIFSFFSRYDPPTSLMRTLLCCP